MDADLDDQIQRYLSDCYNGTTLVEDSQKESVNVENPNTIEIEEPLDYKHLYKTEITPELLDRIVYDIGYEKDSNGNIVTDSNGNAIKYSDGQMLLNFLEKQGYNYASRLAIKSCLNSDECREFCSNKGYQDTSNGIYSQIEFLLKESKNMNTIYSYAKNGNNNQDGAKKTAYNFAWYVLGIRSKTTCTNISADAYTYYIDAVNK